MKRDGKLLIGAKEAAPRLSISRNHLQRLTAAGKIPCIRLGGRVLYSVRDLEQLAYGTEVAK